MDVKEMNIVLEETTNTKAIITTTMTKPTTIITQMATKEYLKILETTEYCRMAQSTLKECENKIQVLVSAKNETARLKTEYLTRNKINITNSESLLQAKNELFQYKCELKSNYVAVEKSVKTKKIQYQKLLSSYETDWQKALKEYTSNPLAVELRDIQHANTIIERNIEKETKLNESTKIQVSEIQQNLKKNFLNKILEFSNAMIQYKKYLISQNNNREKNENEHSENHSENAHLKFTKSLIPTFDKSMSFDKDDGILNGFDVALFDELMVPSEHLEIQNEDEELFHLIQNQQMGDDNSDREQSIEISLNEYHHPEDQEMKQRNTDETTNTEKAAAEEGESQYFRIQGPEFLKQSQVQSTTAENWGHAGENLNEYGNKEFNENSLPSTGVLKGNVNHDDNIDSGKQIDSEKSLSEASYENQISYARDNFGYKYPKTQSVSSEEMPLSAENESFESPRKPINIEQTNIFKLQGDQEKEDIKSFGDFFTINSDQNSAKPSIFQLF